MSTQALKLATWLAGYDSPATERAYRRAIERLTEAVGPPHEARAEDAAAYFATLPPGAKAQALAAAQSFLRFGEQATWWPPAPLMALRAPRAAATLVPLPPEPAAIQAVIEAETGRGARQLLGLLYIGGLRVSEAALAHSRDIDPEAPVLRIPEGKGRKGRAIRLPDAFVALLRAAPYGFFASANRPDPSVGPISTRWAHHLVAAAGARIGLHLHPHALRHAHATQALRNGCPIHVLQASLGHSSVRTTGRYAHAIPAEGAALYLASDPITGLIAQP